MADPADALAAAPELVSGVKDSLGGPEDRRTYGAAGPQGPRRVFYARVSPGSVQCGYVDGRDGTARTVREEGTRRAIEGFTADSRNRLFRRALSLPWRDAVGVGGIGMVTCTYPAEFPTDGRVVKAQWERLYGRWVRHYGVPKGMWKMEFQERGAPHFHAFVGYPEEEELLRVWLLDTWYECVGSGDERHLQNGVDTSRWRWGSLGQNAAKVGEYFARHGAKGWKSYQNQLPAGYTSPGRWWGVWGKSAGFAPIEVIYEFSTGKEYFNFRRNTWTLQAKNRGRAPRKGGSHKGAWSVSVDGLTTGSRWIGVPS